MSVVVFTKNGCQPCKATKRKFEKEGIAYNEINLDENPEAKDRIVQLGYSAAPIIVAGDQHWAGFQPDRIMGLKAA